MPGRKTDVSDAQWLRRLHEYGLLRASFRPKGELAALRAYLRQRERLLDYSASHIQHMQKTLMQMNVQLHHVVTDITGETGMRIIRAVVAGERDPAILATHRDRRCHASEAEIAAALAGNWREELVFALGQALELYDAYHAKCHPGIVVSALSNVRLTAELGIYVGLRGYALSRPLLRSLSFARSRRSANDRIPPFCDVPLAANRARIMGSLG